MWKDLEDEFPALYFFSKILWWIVNVREFPGGPVIRTWAFISGALSLIPDQGTKILQASWHKPKKMSSLVAWSVKNPPAMWETWVQSLGWEDPLEKGMVILSSILCWKIPWTEDSGRLHTVHRVSRVGHNLAMKQSPPQLMSVIPFMFKSWDCLGVNLRRIRGKSGMEKSNSTTHHYSSSQSGHFC